MSFKNLRALLLLGLAACGGGVELDALDEESNTPVGQTEQQVIVGTLNWTSVTSLSSTSPERARSRAVGYLSIPAVGSRCTAWLVSNDKVVTNNHCISSASQAAGARVSFNYEDGVASSSRIWYDCSTFVRTWSADDMTVLACKPLNGSYPGQVYGYLRVAPANAASNTSGYVIHQNCDYKTTSGCTPTKKFSPGYVTNGSYDSNELSHDMDTLGGSSGSPVLARSGTYAHYVVGLHHVGLGDGDGDGRGTGNLAVKAGNIRAHLAELGL